MTNYKVNVIYIIEANSPLHAEMIVKQHLKGKGEVEKTEDYWGYDEIKVIEQKHE